MKKIVSLFLSLVLLLGVCAALASCGAPEDDGAEISVYLGGQVYDLDPSEYYVSDNAAQVMSLLYEPLFSLNEKGEAVCAAASDYTVDTEERTITVNLRESYWSDQIRVTAEDFVYAWRDVILEPSNANPAATLLYGIENAKEIKSGEDITLYKFGVKAEETYKLVITYREGADYKQLIKNLASIATAPLRQDVVAAKADYWSKDVSTICTNGPFKLDSYNALAGEFTVARNLGYHQHYSVEDFDNNVVPSKLVSFVSAEGEDYVVSYSDLENKTVFFLGEAPLSDVAANADKATVTDTLSTYTYVFNTTKAPFNNANVRKALSLALDRQAIASAVTFGKAANGLLPDATAKSIYGKNITDRISASPDMAAAKALIDAESLTAAEKKFTLTVNDDERSLAIAELAKAAWAELGFTVTVKAVGNTSANITDNNGEPITVTDSSVQTLAIRAAQKGERDFDVLAVDWQMYSADAFVALSAFSSDMNGNGVDYDNGTPVNRTSITGWTNSAYDKLIEGAYNAVTAEARTAALVSAERFILDSAVVIPVLYNQSYAFVSSELSGVAADGFGFFTFNNVAQKNYKDYLD